MTGLKVYVYPDFGQDIDPGDGGVRRVVEAQRRYLPEHGIEVVDSVEEADVLAAHMVATPAMLRSTKPLVAHNHGFYWSEYAWGGKWAEKDNGELMRAIRRAQAVTAPSQWVANIIRRHTSRPVTPIIHGVDMPAEVEENEGYVLWNKTRVDPICDPAPVLELARRLPDIPFVATTLQLAGQAPNIRATSKLPYLDAVRQVARAGVYLATTRETFGIGTLEAMAAGIPIVGYSFGGQNEIVTHGVDGYLARPGDFDDLAEGVRWALENREAVSAWARYNAQKFSWARPMADYARIYSQVFEASHGANPRVSVIVPAYNMAPYIAETLASVQTQTEPVEIIIVDDASTDETAQLAIDALQTSELRTIIISLPKNIGLSGARNAGIKAAKGRYILPLDADDMLMPNACEILADALDRDRNIDVAYGGVFFVEEDGRTPTDFGPNKERGRSGWPVDYDLALMFERPGQPLPYASMFRREAWEWTGGYRTRVKSSEDCDFWCRLGSYGFTPRKITDAVTLIYRNRPDSMSRTVGWADTENKAWFPWAHNIEEAPGAGQPGPLVRIPAYDPPIVSVIIPVGAGHEGLVLDAIDSVEAQTFRNFEVIVVNDTKGELQPLPAWVHIIKTDGAIGVSAARNAGIAAARGLLFVPLDADDYLMPDFLEVSVRTWQRGDPRTVIYADFWQTPESGGIAMTSAQTRDFDGGRPLLQQAMHPVTALIPVAAWRELEGFAEGVPWEDWDFQFKLYAQAGYCAQRLAAPLWVYRKHTGKRRLDRYNRRELGKADVLKKWGDYIEGKKIMACASCGQRTILPTGMNNIENSRAMRAPAPVEGMELVEYIGPHIGKQSFSGAATRNRYDFQKGRPRYVDPRDVEGFLQAPAMFARPGTREAEPVLMTTPAPVLTAHEHTTPPPPAPPAAVMAPEKPPATTPPVSLPPSQPPGPFTLPAPPAPPPDRSRGFVDPELGDAPDFGAQIAVHLSDNADPQTAIALAAAAKAAIENGPDLVARAAEEAAALLPNQEAELTRTPIGDNGDLVEDPSEPATPQPIAQETPAPPRRGRPPKMRTNAAK